MWRRLCRSVCGTITHPWSLLGLERNNYDKSKCQEEFERFKACQKEEVCMLQL